MCTFQAHYNKFVDAAYGAFLSGVDDEYQHLLADLEKKIGNLLVFIVQWSLIFVRYI